MRRKTLKLVMLTSLVGSMAFAQSQRNCGTMPHLDYLKTKDAGLEERMNQIEQHTMLWEKDHSLMKTSATVVNIPVVVHVLYNTTSQNISDAQVKSQIDVLNEDFRKLNADRTNVPSAFAGLASDVEINFCLASKNPS